MVGFELMLLTMCVIVTVFAFYMNTEKGKQDLGLNE